MTMSPRRNFVIAITAGDENALRHDPNGSKLLIDDSVEIVRLPLRNVLKDENLNRLYQDGFLVRGSVFVRSPYQDGAYFSVVDVSENFALAKFALFSRFCAYLGAKIVRVTQIIKRDSSGRIQQKSVGAVLDNNGEREVSDETLARFSSRLSLADEYEGNASDMAAANALMKANGLERDHAFSSLATARQGNNLLKRRTVKLNLSQEARQLIEQFRRLSLPDVLVSYNGDRKVQNRDIDEYEVEAIVEF